MEDLELPGNAANALRNSLINTSYDSHVDLVKNNFSSLIYVNIELVNNKEQTNCALQEPKCIDTIFLVTSDVPLPKSQNPDEATLIECASKYYNPKGLQMSLIRTPLLQCAIENIKNKIASAEKKAKFIGDILNSSASKFVIKKELLDAYIKFKLEFCTGDDGLAKYKIKDIQVRINNQEYRIVVDELKELLNKDQISCQYFEENSDTCDEDNIFVFDPSFIVKGLFFEDLIINIPNINSALVLDSLTHLYCSLFAIYFNPARFFKNDNNLRTNQGLVTEETAGMMLPEAWLTAYLMGFPLFSPRTSGNDGALRFVSRTKVDIKEKIRNKPIVALSSVTLPDSYFKAYMMDLSASEHSFFCPNVFQSEPRDPKQKGVVWVLFERLFKFGYCNRPLSLITTSTPTVVKTQDSIYSDEKNNKLKKSASKTAKESATWYVEAPPINV